LNDSFVSGNATILSLVCIKGHTWTTKAAYTIRGSWCTKCTQGRKRRAVRAEEIQKHSPIS
jgi:hypothetical protein